MGLLKWNQEKVRQMSPNEIAMFIAGRVLAALGIGMLVAEYFPQPAAYLAVLLIVVGLILFAIGVKGVFRRTK